MSHRHFASSAAKPMEVETGTSQRVPEERMGNPVSASELADHKAPVNRSMPAHFAYGAEVCAAEHSFGEGWDS